MAREIQRYQDREVFKKPLEKGPFDLWMNTLVISSPHPLFSLVERRVVPEGYDNTSRIWNELLEIAHDIRQTGVNVAIWHKPSVKFKDELDIQLGDQHELIEGIDAIVQSTGFTPATFDELPFPDDFWSTDRIELFDKLPVELVFARNEGQKCLLLTDQDYELVEIPNATSLVKGEIRRFKMGNYPVTEAFLRWMSIQDAPRNRPASRTEEIYRINLKEHRTTWEQTLVKARTEVFSYFS